jgi:ABC-2 type transport system permease protein
LFCQPSLEASSGCHAAAQRSVAWRRRVEDLLYLFPILAHLVPDPELHRHLEQIGPMTAGLAIHATTHVRNVFIGPWAGLWRARRVGHRGLLAGGHVLRLRDA